MGTQGGPAKRVSVQGGGRQQGGPAIPITVVTDGRTVEGGPAMPIYLVTSGPMQDGPALPVVAAPAGAIVAGGPAVPAYVVGAGFAPANTVLPVISGITTVGQTLSTTNGTWTSSPTSFTYQWKRNGANIGGATNTTYVLQAADANTTITVTVTATNASGSTSATSAGTSIGLVLNGLVSEYRFDEGSGTTLTDYVSGYNGTLGTGPGDRPDWVAAGLDFVPGNADVVSNATMPDSVLLGALTACVVAQIDTGSAFRYFLGKHLANAATQTPLEFRTSNAATPVITVSRANANTRSYTGPNCAVGAYRMYSVTYPDGNVNSPPTFYVGATGSGNTGSGGVGAGAATGSNANFVIGRRPDGVCQMDGIMAYILIYNRELSAAEIAQNYTVLRSRLAPRGIILP